jgi:hypothetical protein
MVNTIKLTREKAAIVTSAIDAWVETEVISGEDGKRLEASIEVIRSSSSTISIHQL